MSLDNRRGDKTKDGRVRSKGGMGRDVWVVEGEDKRKDGRERSKGGMTSGVLIAEVEIRRKMVG